MDISQKWIDEGGVFYPIPGETTLHHTPGSGVFQLYKNPSPTDGRLGLVKLSDKFDFNFKIYDLGYSDVIDTVITTWESDLYIKSKRNLGVIFNGIKGTSKTISAKLLCNKLGIPVIIVQENIEGMTNFLQSLCFECVVFIDEAEKTFKKGADDEILVKLIDGVYNKTRKLYLLTTNKLDVNENLLGRPGRIRYIKQFGNLSENVIKEYIADNLIDKSKTDIILKTVDLLEISTIDILKCIVEEVNIHGTILEDSCLNVPKAKYVYDVIRFTNVCDDTEKEIREFFKEYRDKVSVAWLNEVSDKPDKQNEGTTNEDYIYEKYNGWSERITSQFSGLWKNSETSAGTIIDDIDDDGFIKVNSTWGDEYFYKILRKRDAPSLYRGGLAF